MIPYLLPPHQRNYTHERTYQVDIAFCRADSIPIFDLFVKRKTFVPVLKPEEPELFVIDASVVFPSREDCMRIRTMKGELRKHGDPVSIIPPTR